jgi:MobA/MobL family
MVEGGRTEYRLVFELPREFDHDQRAAALELLCRRFEELGCMYVAVIHAPDAHNDQTNYHVHLDFYDRKCRRLDGTENDLTNVKPQFLASIRAEIAEGRFSEEVRKRSWDFIVERTYQSNKKKKTHRPFGAARKARAVRGRSFVKQVREEFAKDINAVARKGGLKEIYDPRDYAAMGINAPASEKLGPKKHGQEVRGIPTSVGIDNERAQAEFEIRLIERAYEGRCGQIDEIQLRWQSVSQLAPAELTIARRAVEDELAMARRAAEIRRELDLLELERERERSRARLVSERQGRAARTGSAAARSRSANLAQVADEYLSTLDERDVALIAAVNELERIASSHAPEHAAGAVLDYERQVARLDADRARGVRWEEASPLVRRNIMVRRGALGEAGTRPQIAREVAQTAPVRAAQPNSPIAVKRGPAEPPPPPTAAFHPPQSASLVSHPSGDQGSAGAIPDRAIIDQTAQAAATEDRQQPHVEPSAPPGGITEGAHTSLFVENVPPPVAGFGPTEVADRAEPPAPHVARMEPENRPANTPSQVAHAKATSTPLRAGIRASFTAAQINEILRPRVVGADGVFKPREELDEITVAKVIWAYGDLSPGARAALGATELYATAEGHRQADALRAALVRGRTKVGLEASPKPTNPRPQPESSLTDQGSAKEAQMDAALHAQQGRGGI